MKFLSHLFAAFLGAAALLYLQTVTKVEGPTKSASVAREIELTFADLASIGLTAVTIVLAVTALLVGYLAFKTKGEIQEDAREIARAEVGKEVTSQVGIELPKAISERLPKAIDSQLENALSSASGSGKLDRALEAAILRLGQGSDFDQPIAEDREDEEHDK